MRADGKDSVETEMDGGGGWGMGRSLPGERVATREKQMVFHDGPVWVRGISEGPE